MYGYDAMLTEGNSWEYDLQKIQSNSPSTVVLSHLTSCVILTSPVVDML